MLKILYRLSRFLTKWSFCANFFHAPGSKNFLSYYLYRTIFLKKKNVNAKKGKNWKYQQKTRGATETVEKLKLNSSCKAEETFPVRKTN